MFIATGLYQGSLSFRSEIRRRKIAMQGKKVALLRSAGTKKDRQL